MPRWLSVSESVAERVIWLFWTALKIEFPYWLNPEAEIDLDVACFQNLLAQSQEQSDPTLRIPLLSEASKLYRNHLLTGFSLKDSFPFNEWAFAELEELRSQLAAALTTLSDDYCRLGKADKALPHARRY